MNLAKPKNQSDIQQELYNTPFDFSTANPCLKRQGFALWWREAARAASPAKADKDIDQSAFQQEWLDLQDTHDFFGFLRRHGVSRTQALRLAPEGHATPIAVSKIEELLHLVAEKGLEIMVFIGNNHCLQIHTGKAERILRTGPWINILDADFNMHLRDEALNSVWVVKKPTNMGSVHSIEAYDVDGNLVAQFFGKRKPDVPEREDWQQAIHTLTS